MIAMVFPILAFCLVFVVSQRSLTFGLLGTIAVGYFSGIVRANFQSIATTFFFDAGIAGLFFSCIFGHTRAIRKAVFSQSGQFCLLLIIWPLILSMAPVNNFWVQLVALRGSVLLLPIFIIATKLTKDDALLLARGFAVLNLIAMVIGIWIYFVGVEKFYPVSAVTRIIYNSQDAGAAAKHRIPSTFLSAHAYGNTMVLTLPMLMGSLLQRKRFPIDATLLSLGVIAAIVGILLCAARQPLWFWDW